MKTHVGQQQGFHLCLRPLLRLSQEPVFNAILKNYVEMSPLLLLQFINIQSAVLPRCRIRNICPSSQLVFIDPDTGPLNVDTRQNPRGHVVFIKSSQMRKISTCLRRQGSPDYSLGWFISVCEFRQYWGHISKPNILQLQNVGRFSYLLSTFATVVKKHIYKNLPPQDKS